MLTNEIIIYGQEIAKANNVKLIGMSETKVYGENKNTSITFVFNKEGVELK